MKVLVIGGTGNFGGEVIKSMRDRGADVRCLSRFANKLKSLPAGVEGCVGDLEKPGSLSVAFDGVDRVFLMTPLSRNEAQLGFAAAAAIALLVDGHDGREYPLHGPDALTGETVAATFSKHLGRPVRYGGNNLEEWAKPAQHMMPGWMVQELRAMYDLFQQHGMIARAEDFELQRQLLGKAPRSFDAFVSEVVSAWRQQIEGGNHPQKFCLFDPRAKAACRCVVNTQWLTPGLLL